MSYVVTGASGVVGRELIAWLTRADQPNPQSQRVVAVLRVPQAGLPPACTALVIPDLNDVAAPDAIAAQARGGILLHLAALTPGGRHPAEEFHRINAAATGRLARAAVKAGVLRFVYLSSTHASAALTSGTAIDETTPAIAHADPYGASKLAGEDEVRSAATGSGMQWTIVRSPLVYGPGTKGSLALLARAVVRGLPLPLGSVSANARDMIGVRNLAAFLELAAAHPRAANEAFVVCDGEPVSTRSLIEGIAAAAGRKPRLAPVPAGLLRLGARAVGAGQMAERLIGDHKVNDSKARQLLGWRAPYPRSFDIERMVSVMGGRRN